MIICVRQFGRVVKASDSKSDGVTRVGSNPAAVEIFCIIYLIDANKYKNNQKTWIID